MRTILILLLLTPFILHSQHKETISQNRADHIGVKTKKDFKQAPHVKWFDESYNQYQLNPIVIKKIKKRIESVKIKVFMSVWCHDSHREVPQLYKILEAVNFNEDNLELVALNRAKKTPNNLQEGFNIKRTPTLIFYRNSKEIGRYVEKPRKSLEKDILAIISGKKYKHSYNTN